VVPGNHDVPLFNVFARFFDPLGNYRHIVTPDLQPFYRDGELAVLGINTARSLAHKGGRIATEQVAEASRRFKDVPEAVVKVVVTHHPFDLADPLHRRHLVGRARLAMRSFAGTGVDLLLAGHFHASQAIPSATHYQLGAYSAVVVQASTATSTRLRKQPNAFNLIEIDGSRIVVNEYSWDGRLSSFGRRQGLEFVKGEAGWLPAHS
jgi:3',5'-cyclic AMP phosphodiesterase CpdA